jgi:hypothetical protein
MSFVLAALITASSSGLRTTAANLVDGWDRLAPGEAQSQNPIVLGVDGAIENTRNGTMHASTAA